MKYAICTVFALVLFCCSPSSEQSGDEGYVLVNGQKKKLISKADNSGWVGIPEGSSFWEHTPTHGQQLADSIDHRPFQTPVRDQGETQDCVDFSIIAAMEAISFHLGEKTADVSEGHLASLYSKARLQDGLDAASSKHLTTEQIWPHHLKSAPSNISKKPYGIIEWHPIEDPTDTEWLRAKLNEGQQFNIILTMTYVATAWANSGYVNVPFNEPDDIYAHAGLIVGYKKATDLNGEEQWFFLFKNSFGTQYGIDGYNWISEKYIQTYALMAVVVHDVRLAGGTEKPPECDAPCPFIGAIQCDGQSAKTCKLDKITQCRVWSVAAPCPAGGICENGECKSAQTCTDQCTLNTNDCDGNTLKKCTQQSNGCLDWNSGMSCGANQICKNGQCVTEAECTKSSDCTTTDKCQTGSCVNAECTFSPKSCSSGKQCDPSTGNCVTPPECNKSSDCPNKASTEWTQCNYSGDCDESAPDKTMTTYTKSCSSGKCSYSPKTTTAACTQNTDGDPCGSGGYCYSASCHTNGDSAYCTAKVKAGLKCKEGESDCESGECDTGLYCDDVTGDDYCCPVGEDWKNGKCEKPECSSSSDCPNKASTGWTQCNYSGDCDESAPDKTMTTYTKSCSSGKCSYSPKTTTAACTQNTDGDPCGSGGYCYNTSCRTNGDSYYCKAKVEAGLKCKEGESDCASGECATGLYCDFVTGDDYCCPDGEDWTGSKCEASASCDDKTCDSDEDPKTCPEDCGDASLKLKPSLYYKNTPKSATYSCDPPGGTAKYGWHPGTSGGLPYWTWISDCKVTDGVKKTPTTYTGYNARYTFTTKKAGNYKIAAWFPDSNNACGKSSSNLSTQIHYVLDRYDATNLKVTENQAGNMGEKETLWSSVTLQAGTHVLFLFDDAAGGCSCNTASCSQSNRVFADHVYVDWVN